MRPSLPDWPKHADVSLAGRTLPTYDLFLATSGLSRNLRQPPADLRHVMPDAGILTRAGTAAPPRSARH